MTAWAVTFDLKYSLEKVHSIPDPLLNICILSKCVDNLKKRINFFLSSYLSKNINNKFIGFRIPRLTYSK